MIKIRMSSAQQFNAFTGSVTVCDKNTDTNDVLGLGLLLYKYVYNRLCYQRLVISAWQFTYSRSEPNRNRPVVGRGLNMKAINKFLARRCVISYCRVVATSKHCMLM